MPTVFLDGFLCQDKTRCLTWFTLLFQTLISIILDLTFWQSFLLSRGRYRVYNWVGNSWLILDFTGFIFSFMLESDVVNWVLICWKNRNAFNKICSLMVFLWPDNLWQSLICFMLKSWDFGKFHNTIAVIWCWSELLNIFGYVFKLLEGSRYLKFDIFAFDIGLFMVWHLTYSLVLKVAETNGLT